MSTKPKVRLSKKNSPPMSAQDARRSDRSVECWHFLPREMQLGFLDGRKVRRGVRYKAQFHHSAFQKPYLCRSGMHGCVDIYDAIRWARSKNADVLCRVVIENQVVGSLDKVTGLHRTIWWHIPARPVFVEFLGSLGLPKGPLIYMAWTDLCTEVSANLTPRNRRKLRHYIWKQANQQWDLWKSVDGGPWKRPRG